MPGKVQPIEMLQFIRDVECYLQRRCVIADDVRCIPVLPVRFHEAKSQAFVYVVLATLLRVHRAVVKALVCDPLFILYSHSAESANEDQGKCAASSSIVRHVILRLGEMRCAHFTPIIGSDSEAA